MCQATAIPELAVIGQAKSENVAACYYHTAPAIVFLVVFR